MHDFILAVVRNSVLTGTGLTAIAVVSVLIFVYYYLLPKPIKGIPYNASATSSLLGDIPALMKESPDNAFDWMKAQTIKLSSPICQLFITPFGRPVVLLSDYHESQDILMRRKEFDRSDYSIALLSGIAEHHHINMKTGPTWKAHRRLLQDLMTPKFLHNVAGPNIYTSASRLVSFWTVKNRIANGRPYMASRDIYYTALDAVFDFTFGDGYHERALAPQIKAVQEQERHESSMGGSNETPVEFPAAPLDSNMVSFLQASEAIGDVANSGFFSLAWWWKKLQPKEKKHRATRRRFLEEQMAKSAGRAKLCVAAGHDHKPWIGSAADLMAEREKSFAEKEGRMPVYWSETMHDEMLGFIIAGHDTTSTTLCWAVKLLADNQASQSLLRERLQSAYPTPWAEKRNPTYPEILEMEAAQKIPYLDAVIEEILRLSATLPVLERQTTQDTVVLGHHIPKDTIVFMLGTGPSITQPGFDVDDTLRNKSSRNALLKEKGGKRVWPSDVVGMDEFRPERWLVNDDEKKNISSFNGTAGPTLPFGLGLRGCFGRKMAYLELKLVITLIIWNFEFLTCPAELSGYESVMGLTNLPKSCYIRTKQVIV